MELSDDDLAPLEPPEALIPLSPEIVAAGRGVLAMPCANPAFSPTLDVVGFPGMGWNVRVKDAYGTLIFSVMLRPVGAEGV